MVVNAVCIEGNAFTGIIVSTCPIKTKAGPAPAFVSPSGSKLAGLLGFARGFSLLLALDALVNLFAMDSDV